MIYMFHYVTLLSIILMLDINYNPDLLINMLMVLDFTNFHHYILMLLLLKY